MNINLKKIFRKLSLVQKFSVAVFSLVAVMMVIVTGLIISHQKSALRSEMDKNHVVIVRNLAKDAVEPLILMDPLRLDGLVRAIAQTPGFMYALVVVDRDKRIVAHTNRVFLGQTLPARLQKQALSVLTKGETYIGDSSQDGVKEILVPVKIGYEVVGMVMVGFSRESTEAVVEDTMKELKRYVYFISALVIFIGIGGAVALAKQLTTPMKKLKDKMELVQTGNLDVTVPNDSLQNCWEVQGCDLKDCPAYGKQRCWTISGTRCFGCVQGGAAEKIGDCKKCIVYRESCGDEVGELIEVFNQMVGDLKSNLRELEEANQEKFRLDRLSALGQVAAGVAHEINNPLGGIGLCFNNLIETNMDEDTRRQHIEVIKSGFDRIQSIVKRLLDFSKNSALSMSRSSINTIVRNVLKLSEYTILKKGIKLVEQLSGDLPALMVDPNKLEQVFLNLIINAVQAMEGGGVLTIRTESDESKCRVSFTDTGKGIPREVITRIFDPFFTTKDTGEGTGLGLSVSKALIEQHKGDITVKTSEEGTTFTVQLPLS
ncbi:MAG: ATP-binding protein [Nitrospirota bacterium]